jgi:hypothetical protein
LSRHLPQYLIGQCPFFLTVLQAPAKFLVGWRHCGGCTSKRIKSINLKLIQSKRETKARETVGLAHLVAGRTGGVALPLVLCHGHHDLQRLWHGDILLAGMTVPLRRRCSHQSDDVILMAVGVRCRNSLTDSLLFQQQHYKQDLNRIKNSTLKPDKFNFVFHCSI